MIRFIFSTRCKKLRAAIWGEDLLINDLNVQEAIYRMVSDLNRIYK